MKRKWKLVENKNGQEIMAAFSPQAVSQGKWLNIYDAQEEPGKWFSTREGGLAVEHGASVEPDIIFYFIEEKLIVKKSIED